MAVEEQEIRSGTVEELAETVSDAVTRRWVEEFRSMAILADTIARAILFAIEQPANVDVGEMIVRPTGER